MIQSPRLSVVIPSFNEVESLSILTQRLSGIVEKDPRVEFIIVNNGSTDGTDSVLSSLIVGKAGLRAVHLKENIGYGNGIKFGLRHSNGDFTGWTHADLQTNPEDVVRALDMAVSSGGNVIVKGERVGRPIFDRLFSLGMSVFESLLFRQRLREINAQPTIFSSSLRSVILDGPDDFGLDLFALIASKRRGYVEKRIPVRFDPRFFGQSKWNNSLRSRVCFILRTISFSLSLARSEKVR